MRWIGITRASAVVLAACGGTTATGDTASQAQAQTSDVDGGAAHGHRHGLPPEAFDACIGKAAGNACAVTHGDESLTGTCVTPPADAPDSRIVCRPDRALGGHDHRGHGGPPQEAFTACTGKSSGAACTATFGDHTVDGTCKEPPPGVNDTRLACAPAHPPKHGDAPSP